MRPRAFSPGSPGLTKQGALKKKRRTPTWLVGSSEAKKVPGLVRFFPDFFIVFLNSPHRETPKNVIKKSRKIGFGFFVVFFAKTFRHDFFVKRFL
jgi:hypothetical protein